MTNYTQFILKLGLNNDSSQKVLMLIHWNRLNDIIKESFVSCGLEIFFFKKRLMQHCYYNSFSLNGS
jgi:hypothetical protein